MGLARRRELDRYFPLAVGLAAFAAFLPALTARFVWDDYQTLVLNARWRGLGPAPLHWMFTTFRMGPYMPLTWLSWSVDYAVWGAEPIGFHLTNLLLHAAAAILYLHVAAELLRRAAPPASAAQENDLSWCAAFAALLFAVHPLRVEAVAWVTERREVLAGALLMAAVLLYVRAADSPERPRRSRLLAASVAAYGLSLLAKASGLPLPAALFALDAYPLRRRSWADKLPYAALALPAAALALAGQAHAGLAHPAGDGLGPKAADASRACWFYLAKTAWPAGLSPLYELKGVHPFLEWPNWAAGLGVVAATAAAWAARRRWPAAGAAWAWYLVFLAPVSGLVRIGNHAAADRYTYLACLPWPMLAAAAYSAAAARWSVLHPSVARLKRAGTAVIIAILAALAWRQTRFWKNGETLWTRALEVDPRNAIAHNNLGNALLDSGKPTMAKLHYERSAALAPGNPQAHYNLGTMLASERAPEKAAEELREALRLDPAYASAHLNLGNVLLTQGRAEEALVHYREAERLAPDDALAANGLGSALAMTGRREEAVESFKRALELDPRLEEAGRNLEVARRR